jgi:hypothetical protein
VLCLTGMVKAVYDTGMPRASDSASHTLSDNRLERLREAVRVVRSTREALAIRDAVIRECRDLPLHELMRETGLSAVRIQQIFAKT